MLCPRCGAELFPGMTQCPECGASAYANAYKTASITVTAREARQGAFKTLNMPNLSGPVRFRVKPGTKNGAQVMVNSAVFKNPDGSTMLVPVRVTVHVKKNPAMLLLPLVVVLLCASLVAGVMHIASALTEDDEMHTQMQTASTEPVVTLPQQISTPVSTEPPAVTEPPAAESPVQPETEPAVTEPPQTQPSAASGTIAYFELRPLLHQLSDEMLANLEALYQTAMRFEEKVEFPYAMTPDELSYLTALMHTEFPELMQLDNTVSTHYYTDSGGNVVSYELPYVLTEAEYKLRSAACLEVIASLVVQTEGMDDWDKERYVYDYITSTCVYDKDVEESNTPYGTLVSKTAKCDGISLAMKWIMEEMGITCLCITGDPTVGDIGHAWNIIRLDGNYYCVDVTADVNQAGDNGPCLYKALNVTSELVLQDYVLTPVFTELLSIPNVTTMEKSYHVQNGSYIRAGSDWKAALAECFIKAYDSGEASIIQFESQADYDACMQNLNDNIKEAAASKNVQGYSGNTTNNDSFRVLCLTIKP